MKYEILPQEKAKLNLSELWQYRELLYMFAFRDFKVRYAQTFLGILWAFIQPFTILLIFTIIFGKALKVNTGNIPYPIFALSGMIPWSYFSYVFSQAGSSIIGNQSIVSKIYFPRLIIPLSKIFVGLIDLGIVMLFMSFVLIYYNFVPSANVVFIPFFLFLLIILSSAIGILFSALSIRYRDIQYVIPFLVQVGVYLTPVAFPLETLPEKFQFLSFLNPMTGIVEGFRWCITGFSKMQYFNLIFTTCTISILFILSIFYFHKIENTIADIV